MLYLPPHLTDADLSVLALIETQRERLRLVTDHTPKRWFGSLRRTTFARAIRGSNSIEGYHATLDQAVAVVENEPPLDERTETWMAITGYRNALTYIMQAAADPYFEFSKQYLKSLHFMMLGHDMSKSPGQWRSGPIYVVQDPSGETVYTGPDADHVDGLVTELVAALKETSLPPIVRAAMAHLNLTMIHPFRDGNGRMARALQTMVLAQDGRLHPVFCSIEEWLGANTESYHAVLAETGRGEWRPEGDASAWLRFCLRAHYQQAATLMRRNAEYEVLFDRVAEVARRLRAPDRGLMPLFDATLGLRITNARYRADAEVSELLASRDLKRLADTGLLVPHGEKRGRFYLAGPEISGLRAAVRQGGRPEDPYAVVARTQEARDNPSLPGL